jgi:endonuclease/exonuclease/phosphatase family metal-dependent hydrolase
MMRRLAIASVVVLVCASFAACASSDRPTLREPAPKSTPMEQFRVLTYNVLHGLEVRGWSVEPVESKEEQRTRFDLQVRQLFLAQPDVILLQEVNPLPERAEAFATALNTFGLQYAEVHQADSCGVRLFGVTIVPPGLSNGLAILAKAPLRLRKLVGLKLSGGFGYCGDVFGLHLGELRYALIAEVDNPNTGNKLVVVSLHLYSGIERTDYFIRRVTEAEEQGTIGREDLQNFVAALEQDQNRRLGEIRVLVRELQRLGAEGTYLGAIVGGDFNLEPGSVEYRELLSAGLRDTYMKGSGSDYTYDPEENMIAGQIDVVLPPSLRQALTSLPEEEQRWIVEGYRKGMGQARRIDFLFHMGDRYSHVQGCVRQALYGEPVPGLGIPGSDHYGVLNTYILGSSDC